MDVEQIETRGLGAGSYPEPPEPKLKIYNFEFEGTIKGRGYVYAEDEFSASLKASQGDYEEVEDTWDLEIENITKVELD